MLVISKIPGVINAVKVHPMRLTEFPDIKRAVTVAIIPIRVVTWFM